MRDRGEAFDGILHPREGYYEGHYAAVRIAGRDVLRGGRLGALGERGSDALRGTAAATAATRGALARAFRGGLGGALRLALLARGLLGDGGRDQTPLRAGGDVEVLVQVRAGGVGLDRLRLAELEGAVDQGPLVQVLPVHERDGDAGAARAARAAGAVQVRLVLVRDGVVDHVGDVVDVDAAGGDVGRDEHVLLAGLERGHRALALVLAHVAVHAADIEAAVAELVDEALRGTLGAREDDGLAAALCLQDAGDDLVLVERVCPVHEMADVRLREALVGVVGADVDRVRHEAARQRHDRTRHGRREQLGVPHRRDLLEDLLDVGEEAEVEHLVGLVEHDLGRVREVEQTLVGEVDETARGADDDLRAGLELLDLALVRLAAVDGDDARGTAGGEQIHVLVDLDRELAGRHHDQRLDAGLRAQAQTLHHGDAEAEGLAGARLGLADDVLAGKAEGDGLLLDREGVHDAFGRERVHDVLVDAEIGESRHCLLLPVRRALRSLRRLVDGSTPNPYAQARGSDPSPERDPAYRRPPSSPGSRGRRCAPPRRAAAARLG
ncbi:hypothetical protein RL72_00414 [Microbacterium azadirachtae]|uniref:NAD-specific glutamate dehydrogenase n=1 Tax=Microbacterium azadirachtae TaxID=582680 RepID=A0A0F0L432_9MICO|nr:hypothetical protein RL72_00414 [Microbacterium azadirachtae]